MCIHSKRDYERVAMHALRKMTQHQYMAVFGPLGGFKGAWYTDAASDTSVANTLRDLKSWHGGSTPDLTYVNAYREKKGLEKLGVDGKPLPKPNRKAQKEFSHTEVDALLKEQDERKRHSLMINYLAKNRKKIPNDSKGELKIQEEVTV